MRRKTRKALAQFDEVTPNNRSRLTNGRRILPGVDMRSELGRRYRDIAGAIVSDQGGVEHCSEARLQLIRRFAAAAVLAEQREAALANGAKIDINEHALLVSSLCRVARQIGVDRIARNVTPTLRDYLEGKVDAPALEVSDDQHP